MEQARYLVKKEGTLNGFDLSSDPSNAFCLYPEDWPTNLAECVDVLIPSLEVVVNPHLVRLKEARDSTKIDLPGAPPEPKKGFFRRFFSK